MADNPPPRLRTSYLLGLSNKPFKDPPKPPPLNSYRGILRTPGAAIEWAASDGRRGRLTGKGKPRILGALDAAVAAKGLSKGNTNHDAAKNVTQSGKGGNEASKESSGQANDTGEIEYKKNVPNEYGFTEEQDKTIMRMKTEKEGIQWSLIAEATGKKEHECKTRFKQIKPDGWKPANLKEKGGNKGKDQRNQKQDQKEQDQENDEEKKGEASDGDGLWGGFDPFDTTRDNKSSTSNKDDKEGTGNVGNSWDTGWSGAAGTDENKGENTEWKNESGGGWNNAADNTNADGKTSWDTSGNDGWNADASKEDSQDKKSEDKKSKEKEGFGEKKSRSNDPWGNGDDGSNDGGGGSAAPWGDNSWDTGNKKDKKSDGKSNSGRSNSSKTKSMAAWDMSDDKGGNTDGANDWGLTNDGGGAGAATGGTNPWDNAGCGSATPSEKGEPEDETNEKKYKSSDSDPWGALAATRKSSSNFSSKDRKKHHSSRRHSDSKKEHRSRRHHSSSHSAEYKVAPDGTFSQDDLKLIARILQQDSKMVWERVSWRFKDKTGRNLHPDVFERKITGVLEKERKR